MQKIGLVNTAELKNQSNAARLRALRLLAGTGFKDEAPTPPHPR
jgi:hypothetical protein